MAVRWAPLFHEARFARLSLDDPPVRRSPRPNAPQIVSQNHRFGQSRRVARRISRDGGSYPICWSRIGRELFFGGHDRHIMVAAYTAKGDFFVAGKPQVWSEKRLLEKGHEFGLQLAPDEKRALLAFLKTL